MKRFLLLLLLLAIPPIAHGIAPDITTVKAAVAAANDGDTVTISANAPTGGTWTVGSATGLAYNITAAALQSALIAASEVPAGTVVTKASVGGFTVTWPSSVTTQQTLLAGSAIGITNGLSPNTLAVIASRVSAGAPATPSAPAVQEVQSLFIATPWSGTAVSNALLFINKGITLAGAGIGNTIIANNFTAVGDQNFVRILQKPGQPTRMTGISFRKGTGTLKGGIDGTAFHFQSNLKSNSLVEATRMAASGSLRVDHCELYGVPGGGTITIQSMWGVIDHCLIKSNDSLFNNGGMIEVRDTFMLPGPGGVPDNGYGSEASPSDYGAFHFNAYIEDCGITIAGSNGNVTVDGREGGRQVFRHNYFDNENINSDPKAFFGNHGTERAAAGTRHFELYDNMCFHPTSQTPWAVRSGTGVLFNNEFVNLKTLQPNQVHNHFYSDRIADTTYWGRASGRNPWDINVLTGTVSGFTFQGVTYDNSSNTKPKPYFLGYVASTGSTKLHVVVSTSSSSDISPGWTPTTLWTAYAVSNLTKPNVLANPEKASGADLLIGSTINTNGANTLELVGPSQPDTVLAWSPGDQIAIWKVSAPKAWMIPGRVGVNADALITGNPAVLAPGSAGAGAPGNYEVTEPWYCWNTDIETATFDSATSTWTFVNKLHNPPFTANSPTITQCPSSAVTADCCLVQPSHTVEVRNPVFPWNSFATAEVGPDLETRNLIKQQWALDVPVRTKSGDASTDRHHPLVAPATPQISSVASATFVAGATTDCGSTPAHNCFTITTSGFASPPTLSLTGSWSPSTPGNITFSNGTGPQSGTATFTGTLLGVTPGPYKRTIHATDGSGQDDQTFTLTVAANLPPTVSITSPANLATATTAETVTVTASAADSDGMITKVEFYDGGSLFFTDTSAPFTTDQQFPAGSRVLTAKAYDNVATATPVTSSSVTLTVSPVASITPTPPTLTVH